MSSPRGGGQSADAGSATNISRSAVLRNFPTPVFGISSTNSKASGSHHFANCGSRNSRSSSAVADSPSRRHDDRERPLRPLLVGHGDHRRLGHGRMAHERVLERDRRDPLAAGLDDVLRPVLDPDEAAGMERHDVARHEPAVVRPAIGLVGRVVVAGRDPRPADLELAHRLVVPRDLVAVGVLRAQLDERERNALHLDVVELLRPLLVLQGPGEVADRRDRRRLRHAPAVDDREVVPRLVRVDHRPRRRRAAAEHALEPGEVPLAGIRVELREDAKPDRRHARRPRHLLLLERVEQALAVEVRARVDDVRADHRREVRVAPRVRVEHRHHRQERVGLGERMAERRARGDAERVEDRRAVRVDDALRHARRAARVAHGRGLVLVELRVLPLVRVGAGQQLLVRVLDDEDVLDRRLVLELVEQRQQHLVDDDDLVAGVRRDVREVGRDAAGG